MHRLIAAVSAFTVFGSAAASLATAIQNGNFTANAAAFYTSPGYVGSPGNPAAIAYWNTIANNVGINPGSSTGTPFQPSTFGPPDSPFAFLQSPGSGISQVINGLTIGDFYTVTYDDAMRSNNPGGSGGALVAAVGADSNYTQPSPDHFTAESFRFFASANSVTLSFTNYSTPPGANVTIDLANVAISPEPATLGLFSAGSIVLLGLRRRK